MRTKVRNRIGRQRLPGSGESYLNSTDTGLLDVKIWPGISIKTAIVRENRSTVRDRAVRRIRKVGRRQWKTEIAYHRQARVENAFFRFKSILGDRMRARSEEAQQTEAVIACNILNRMTELGRPESYSIGK